MQGRIQDFKLGEGGALKIIAKIFGVFRVKNHDFTPKNHIFSKFRGGGRVPTGSAPDMQLVLITTKIVSSNPIKAEFTPPIKLTAKI